ncbi:MAG: hypothetical protein ABMA13_12770 [Chthoniobacteraceae bacterium]
MKILVILLALVSIARAQSAWPASVAAESFDVQPAAPYSASMAATWQSAHFLIASESKLPQGLIRDLAAVFEATRAAVRAAPLGFRTAAEPQRHLVRLCTDAASYSRAGGSGGSGASYDGTATVILLPNIGIKPTTQALTTEHTPHLFVLKHIITLQMLGTKPLPMPPWLQTGIAETFAAAPYVRGRYTFTGLDSALRDYLLKWRRSPNARGLRLIAPSKLMTLTPADWQRQFAALSAYDLYNSSALLTHWFLRHDGKGDAAGVAAYLDALRISTSPVEAEQKHLLRGRTGAELDAEVRALARRMALDVQWD